jgi:hypothetical protein
MPQARFEGKRVITPRDTPWHCQARPLFPLVLPRKNPRAKGATDTLRRRY